MVFRGDQKTFVLKPFFRGSDVCTLRKSLGVFSVHATPTTPSLAARKSHSIYVYSPAHAHMHPQLAACLHNVLFSSLLGVGGGPLEELRNAGTFLYTSPWLLAIPA